MALSPSRAEDPRDDRLSDPLRQAADTMRAVRDRCVWTQQIDHRALVPYLVEESAELIDAIEAGPRAEMREELGEASSAESSGTKMAAVPKPIAAIKYPLKCARQNQLNTLH